MNLSSIPMFNMLNHGLAWLTRNHELLSENIANANTPGFAAKKLAKTNFDPIPISVRSTFMLSRT